MTGVMSSRRSWLGLKLLICSTLYLNGLEQIGRMLEQLQNWMDDHGYQKLCDMRGLLSQQLSEQPENYERLQYIKLLSGGIK